MVTDEGDVYTVDTNSRVTDMTILTPEMRIFCHGKHMFWAVKGQNQRENRKLSFTDDTIHYR